MTNLRRSPPSSRSPSAETPIGVYVHWPYCARICPYCDFNVYKTRAIDEAAWIAALRRDLDQWADETSNRSLVSLYFGGGTPSLMPVRLVEAVIEACARRWGFVSEPEIVIEANPTDAERSRFAALAAAGVNRLSLGVQSLRDEALSFLGRNHAADDARRAIATAQQTFARTSFDLIYARPGQRLDDWRAELEEALGLGATHLSLYQLTIEPGTAFHAQVATGRWTPADDGLGADQFDLAQEATAAAGLHAYEISNHAAPGAQSRHNLLYWTYQDYLGVGPGAHGRVTIGGEKLATETPRRPEDYLKDGWRTARTALTAEERIVERLSFGLRLHAGMALDGKDPFFSRPGAREKLDGLVAEGLLVWDGRTLAATARGRRLLNAVLCALL